MAERPIQHFVKGQSIVLEGTPGDRTFRILSGEVLVCKKHGETELVPIATLGVGDMVGEMYLFEPDRARSASVIAISAEVVVQIYFHDEMNRMLKSLNPVAYDLLQGFNRRLKRTSEHVAAIRPAAIKSKIHQLPDGTLKSTGTVVR